MVRSKYPRRQFVSGDGFIQRRYELLRNFVWPESWNDGRPLLHDNDAPVFLASADGARCTANEPIHPTLSKNPKY